MKDAVSRCLVQWIWGVGACLACWAVMLASGSAMLHAAVGSQPPPGNALTLLQHAQYIGAAVAMSAASALDLALTLGYVVASGRAAELMGWPTARALRGWWDIARLSYPACFMKVGGGRNPTGCMAWPGNL